MSAPIPTPTQKTENPWPRWRLPKGTSAASNERLEDASRAAERWEWSGGGLVVLGLLGELVLALIHPAYDAFWGIWGPPIGDALVALGVAVEIGFSRRVSTCQGELTRRSNEKLVDVEFEGLRMRGQMLLQERLLTDAQRETETLRAITAWRRLSENEHKALALALRDGGAGGSVQFSVLMNDQESLHFAQMISIPFKAAGWKVGYRHEAYRDGIMTGILLPEARDNWLEEVRAVNGRVREAFIAAEIGFVNGWPPAAYMNTSSGEPLPVPIAFVYVGPRPMPPL